MNPFSEKFFLWIAFVPSEGSVDTALLQGTLDSKFGFIKSLGDFLSRFFGSFTSGNQPNFTVTLPGFLGRGTFSIIDFGFYNNYRVFIHSIIIGISYILFVRRLMREIPAIIHH